VRRQPVAAGRPARRTAGPVLLAVAIAMGGAALPPPRATADDSVALPVPRRDGPVAVERALSLRRSLREFSKAPLSLDAASQLLWAAQGSTGAGGLRTAPSAGALHPLEVFLVAGAVSGVESAVYRYDPPAHRLLRVVAGDRRAALAEAALGQDWIAAAPAILVIGAVPGRTAAKYGSRAARYMAIEAGHAAENVALQAVALGLGSCDVGAFRDARVQRALELPRDVEPLLLLPVGHPR
jgi:SagB-type dehydrogenase family enzyme